LKAFYDGFCLTVVVLTQTGMKFQERVKRLFFSGVLSLCEMEKTENGFFVHAMKSTQDYTQKSFRVCLYIATVFFLC
jgi:hypothetical protein